MSNLYDLYDLLRTVIAAGVDAQSPEARDELEYAASAITDAIRHETKHARGSVVQWPVLTASDLRSEFES